MDYGKNEIATSYNYKIQWLFAVAPDLFEKNKQEIKDLFSVIRALGANSFDKINFKDSEGKVLFVLAYKVIVLDQKKLDDKVVRHVKEKLNNTNIYYVELIRK
jgi:hypothetical protein